MAWWIKKDAFSELRHISKEVKKALKQLSKIEPLFNQKIKYINEFEKYQNQEGKGRFTLKRIEKELHEKISLILKEFKIEESIIYDINKEESQVLSELDQLIESQNNKKVSERELFFIKNPHKLDIIRFLQELLSLFKKEKGYLERSIKNENYAEKFIYEFKEILKEESKLLGKEKEVLFIIEKELDKEIIEEDRLKFFFVGYGSLMNADEIMGELKTTLLKVKDNENIKLDWQKEFSMRVFPIVVHDYKRIFNKVATRGRWETEEDKKLNRIGVLNIERKRGYFFNAVAIRLTKGEFDSILKRENNYQGKELKNVTDYNTGNKIKGKCFAVISDKTDKCGNEIVRGDIYPVPHYLETIGRGVKKLDNLIGTKNMEKMYLQTTYLNYRDEKLRMGFREINLEEYLRLRDIKTRILPNNEPENQMAKAVNKAIIRRMTK